ncbi:MULTISPECIES: MBL fold metallo-hydrolase [Acinetobacter]|uniref:MBL fold metallo-hydrolase n=1 Tax=Acinetobacter TaxID=469 RepID=UPI00097F9541|nr:MULTISPECIES: MBL fold metallo-hydrolase [Acinetobacter]MEB3794407.1 MBL fold metallo-hydrolase [Acinetobacter sp. IK24]MEB3813317.1 MBL fold metallo-hydrolase [Acinetobacter sp. IK22]MEB3832560.1 MBL fold metallo-hydrolase [Acinetobacter sp. IK23]MEB3838675.1 MBL fold metallo-hydrolase [Acinetobacter sp. IK25]ONN57146.1 Zn-dependent hydrolase [Acinetobacter genomosp. 33YU]
MFFKQFFEQESSTYTYMLGCEETREAILIDPVASDIEIYAKELEKHQFTLIYTLDTHVHADHITAANLLRERFHCKSVLHRNSDVSCGDILITDGCTLKLGKLSIEARYTPGHTNACTSYLVGNMVFTGDALLIDGCGRTDFQQGNAGTLYDSIHKQLFSLPDDTIVYPGHDYKGRLSSTIGNERLNNSRLGQNRSREDFIKLMNNLNLPYPKQIDKALPANQACGSISQS